MLTLLHSTGVGKAIYIAAPARDYYKNVQGWQILVVLVCALITVGIYHSLLKSPGLWKTIAGVLALAILWVFLGYKGLDALRNTFIDTWNYIKAKTGA